MTTNITRALRTPGVMLLILLGAAASVLPAAGADEVKVDASTFDGLRARSLGPATMSGRIAAIDGFAGDRLTLYVGAAGGGVWKSVDGGTTFKPVFDKYTQSIGAIAIDPVHPKTVWVGTGESWTRNSVSIGDGLYKSTDGGDDWQKLGLDSTERIARIAIDPQHPDTVYVAATGHLWNDDTHRGVYRTRDGGKIWERVLYGDASTGCADIVLDPSNPRTVYASLWTFRRKPWSFSSGGVKSGLFKSTDGGTTWRELRNGLPAGMLGRISLAVTPADPARVYAVVEAKESALYRSDDRGESWRKMNAGGNITLRPFYFGRLAADPKNADRVYKPGLQLSISEDGGKTFTGAAQSVHSDMHALWINPNNPEQMFVGCDGGVYATEDRGTYWRFLANIPVGQFYHVSYDMEQPYNVYGGLQDNGSWSAPSQHPGGIENYHWRVLGGGDGFWAFVDPTDRDVAYVEYQGGNVLRVNQSTLETKEIKPFRKSDEPEYRWNWNTPIHLSPTKPGTMYMGSQFLFRSSDRGDHWERISPDLTTNDPLKLKQAESGGLSVDNSSAENHCTIYAISESPKNPQVVWAGTDDGNVQVTKDGGKSWINVTRNIAGLPDHRWVSYLDASRFEEGAAFATFDGHALGDMKTYVYSTSDYGKTWKALATPDLRGYAHTVKQDLVNPNLLFLGTELGLFISVDGGAQWAQFKGNLPNVAVRDLAIHPRDQDLLIATHGRGIYILDDLTPLRALTHDVLTADVTMLPSRPSVLGIPASEQRFDGDATFDGDSPGDHANITYYLKKRHVFGDCKVEVYSPDGKLVVSENAGKRKGLNRVEVPTRMKAPKVPPATNLVPQAFAFVGPRLAPGTYSVKLIKGSETYTTKLELVSDPRSTHSAEDRLAQQKLVRELYDMLADLTYTTDAVASARDQLRARSDSLKASDPAKAKLVALADKFENIRKNLVATREGGRLTGEEQLREKLGALYGAVNGYDGRPTGSQVAYKEVLAADLAKQRQAYDALVAKEVATVNGSLGPKNLAAVAPLTREEWDKKQSE
ncbi:MAG TPA: hypothetical protein VL123_06430 [Candidatus Udaeobacter sp.]|jgi:photosystem II stability/assembly factor-like uncharacterized protein|nr:hypothetical protein [Candidatus Udaeobacter sp.]